MSCANIYNDFLSFDEFRGMKTNFANMDNVKFRRKIVPGETLNIEATLSSFKRGLAKGEAISFVDNEVACSASFVVTLPDVFNQFKRT